MAAKTIGSAMTPAPMLVPATMHIAPNCFRIVYFSIVRGAIGCRQIHVHWELVALGFQAFSAERRKRQKMRP
jgi:hypothetical protein